MSSFFYDLLDFLGVTATVPNNLSELIPYVFTIFVAIGFIFAVFLLFRAMVLVLNRGKLF